MNERVLVTGGAGYIGSVLVPHLLAEGYQVTVLDTFRSGGTQLACACAYPSFSAVKGDARDHRLLDELVPQHDILLPLAALVGAPLCKEDATGATTLNRDAVRALVARCGAGQRMVIPSTNSGYGIGEADQFCNEESPMRPISLYGTTKVEAEAAVLDKGGVSLRLATVFGMSPRMRLDLLVNDFTYRAVTDRAVVIFEGHFKRNYVHIRDVVKGFMHTIVHFGSMAGRPYNLGLSAANLSKIELCRRIQLQIPGFVYLEAPIGEDPDRRNYIVSNAKLEATGWLPDWTIDAGIAELVRGYTMLRNARFSNI